MKMETSELPYSHSNGETKAATRPSYEEATEIEARGFAVMVLNGSTYHVTLNSGRNYRIFKVGKPYILTFRRRPHLFIDNLVQTACFGGLEVLSVVRVVGAVPRFWVQTTSTKSSKSPSSSDALLASGWQRTPAEAMKVLLDKVGYNFVALHKGDAAKAFGITSTEYACKIIRHPELEASVKLLIEATSTQIANLTPVAERLEVVSSPDEADSHESIKSKRHCVSLEPELPKVLVTEPSSTSSASVNATTQWIGRFPSFGNGFGVPSVLPQFPSPFLTPFASPFGMLTSQPPACLPPMNVAIASHSVCDLQKKLSETTAGNDISAPLPLTRTPSESAGVERLERIAGAGGLSAYVDVLTYRRGKLFANDVVKEAHCDDKIRDLIAALASLNPDWTSSSVFKKIVVAAVSETVPAENVVR